MTMRMLPMARSTNGKGHPLPYSPPAFHTEETKASSPDSMARAARLMVIAAAAIAAMAMVVVALWGWQNAEDMVGDWNVSRPTAALWAIRSGAISSAALAQVFILGIISAQLFPRRRGDQAVVLAAAVIFLLSLLSCITLAVVGR